MSAVFYAVIAAIAAGFYSYFQRLASPNVNQLFGALVVSAAALTIAALFLVFQLGKIRLFTNPVGMWFLLGAGARCTGREGISFPYPDDYVELVDVHGACSEKNGAGTNDRALTPDGSVVALPSQLLHAMLLIIEHSRGKGSLRDTRT